jgi:hypothetical protein
MKHKQHAIDVALDGGVREDLAEFYFTGLIDRTVIETVLDDGCSALLGGVPAIHRSRKRRHPTSPDALTAGHCY